MTDCRFVKKGTKVVPGGEFPYEIAPDGQAWISGSPVTRAMSWCWEHSEWAKKGARCPMGGGGK